MRAALLRTSVVLVVLTASVATPARAAPLMIESATTCPSGPAVADALASLSPAAEWPSGTVFIRPSPAGLIVELVAEDVTRRELQVASDCTVRATTVALVVAAWTGALHSEAAGSPVLRPAVSPAPRDAPPTRELPPAPTRTTRRDLGAGIVLSLSGGVAPGLRLGFVETRTPRGLGWQLDVALPAQRNLSQAGVTTRWTRAMLSLALNGCITLRRFALSLDAGLTGAYTLSAGRGYRVDQGAQALTGGLVAGTRVAMPWGPLRVFMDLRGHRWLFPQTVAVDSLAGERVAEVALPSFDLQVTVGLAYPFR